MDNQRDKILEDIVNDIVIKILSGEIKIEYDTKELDFILGKDLDKPKTKVLRRNSETSIKIQ